MRQVVDNLKLAGLKGRLRSGAIVLGGLLVTLGAVGVPLDRLKRSEARQERVVDAEYRLAALRGENEAFAAAGGLEELASQRTWVATELPRGLSRLDLRATVTLLAESCGLDLQTLAVGEFEDAGFERLEDAVGRAEVSLKALAGPGALSELVSYLRGLGLPTVVLDLRLRRLAEDGDAFELSATLGVHQSIPVPASSSPSEDDEEYPQ